MENDEAVEKIKSVMYETKSLWAQQRPSNIIVCNAGKEKEQAQETRRFEGL